MEKIGKKTMLHFKYMLDMHLIYLLIFFLKYFSTLSVTQYFTVDFICTYEMNLYPFDVQKCNGTLEPQTNIDFFVKLVPKHLNYVGPANLMKYQLEKNISFSQTDNVNIQCIHINFT